MARSAAGRGTKTTVADQVVLVTGAAGFVGSAVVRALQARGAKVRALTRPSSPRRNLADFAGGGVEGDGHGPSIIGVGDDGPGVARVCLDHSDARRRPCGRPSMGLPGGDPDAVRAGPGGVVEVRKERVCAFAEAFDFALDLSDQPLSRIGDPSEFSGHVVEADGFF